MRETGGTAQQFSFKRFWTKKSTPLVLGFQNLEKTDAIYNCNN